MVQPRMFKVSRYCGDGWLMNQALPEYQFFFEAMIADLRKLYFVMVMVKDLSSNDKM